MILPLSYNQKVIALSLLHKFILTDAIQIFGNTFGFSTIDARETLTYIQRSAVIVHGVVVEKRGTKFFVISKDGAWDKTVPLDDEYLSHCSYSQRSSFEKAVEMLRERKFSSAA